MSVMDKKFLKVLDDETTFEDGHYVVPMLWKSDEKLPNSSPMASKRLFYLTKRFLASGLRDRRGVVSFRDGLLWRPRLVSLLPALCDASLQHILHIEPLHSE